MTIFLIADAELKKAMLELGEKSYVECLQMAAAIDDAIATGDKSKLINVPEKPIESQDVNFVLFTRWVTDIYIAGITNISPN